MKHNGKTQTRSNCPDSYRTEIATLPTQQFLELSHRGPAPASHVRADACADTRHKNAGVACQNYQWHAPMYQVQHLQSPAPCHAVTFHITSACRRKGARTEKMQTCTPISVSKSHNQERARRQIWSMRSRSDRSSPRPRLPPAFSFSLSLSLYLPCLWTRGSGHSLSTR